MSTKTPLGFKKNRLTYIKELPKQPNKAIRGLFQCECGNKHEAYISNVLRGNVKSCGCYRRECQKLSEGHKHITHGLTRINGERNKLYAVWKTMNHRCLNPKSNSYHNYGARGITVCKEWQSDPTIFYNWSIKNGYKEGLEIDRINNDGNYEPSNVRFITISENCRNRRKTNYITYKGVTKPLIEFAEDYGLKYKTLFNRIYYLKLPIHVALTKKLYVLSNTRPTRPGNYRTSIVRIPESMEQN